MLELLRTQLPEILLGPIVLLSLAGMAFGVHTRLRIPTAISPLVAVSSLILLLYAAALLDVLQPTATCLFWAGLALPWLMPPLQPGLEPVSLRRRVWIQLQEFRAFLGEPSVAMFLLLSLVFWLGTPGFNLSKWDEFSHWGRASRALVTEHMLPGADSGIIFLSYPPAASLFHYFVYTSIGAPPSAGADQEWIFMAAQTMLLLLALPPLLQGMDWKSRPVAGCAVVLGLLMTLTVFGHGFRSVLIDHVLTVFFGAVLVCYLILRQEQRSPLILMPMLAVLPLFKDIGFVLAGLAGMIITADCLWHRGWRQMSSIGIAIALLLTPVAARSSWQQHVQQAKFGRIFDAGRLHFGEIQKAFSPEASEQAREVRAAFCSSLLSRKIGGYSACVVLLLLGQAFYRSRHCRISGEWVMVCGLILGLGVYLFLHLLFYLFLFSPQEGRALASFDRYLETYLGAMTIVGIGLAAFMTPAEPLARSWERLFGVARHPKRLWLGTIAFVGLCVFSNQLIELLPLPFKQRSLSQRAELQNDWELIRAVVPPGKSVFLVWQESNGIENYMGGYELLPRRVNLSAWSQTPLQSLSLARFQAELASFDYIFLGRTDAHFWSQYGSLWTSASASDRPPNSTLFRIHHNSDRTVACTPIDLQAAVLANKPATAPR